MFITLTYFRMIAGLMTIFEVKNCIPAYTEIISETSNPKEDYILYNQKYIDHLLHVIMIKVGKLRTKGKMSSVFLLHSFIVKSD